MIDKCIRKIYFYYFIYIIDVVNLIKLLNQWLSILFKYLCGYLIFIYILIVKLNLFIYLKSYQLIGRIRHISVFISS